MRRIFTPFFIAAALVTASINSFAQCTFNGTTDNLAGAVDYDFTANAQNFTGTNVAWGSQSSNGFLVASAGTTTTVTTPIFYLAPGTTDILIRFTIERTTGSSTISNYAVTATTNTGTISLCPSTAVTPINNSSPLPQYLTVPRGALATGVNFQLNITFTVNGTSVRIDDFATNAIAASGSLPVKFSSFEGKSVTGGVNLTWNVASEDDVARYDVEKSSDNRTYTTIGNVEANGHDSYSFVDTKATTAVTYYRVKAVDIDGKLTYSPVVTMKGGKSSITLRAFPMPVVSELTLQHGTATVSSEITISSAEGRAVKTIVPAKGSQQTTINMASLNAGVYIIRYTNGNGEVETMKIVKQ